MTRLDDALAGIQSHGGVEHLLLVGRDGLLIRDVGAANGFAAETVAAMIPGLATACTALSRATDRGAFTTAVLEFAVGVVVIAPLSSEVLLAAVLRGGVGFAPLLRTLRRERDNLAGLL
ncbi:MAG: roadblock/LC7 domain-containing protein [Gemmatimonadetes bacterium]|nr:roadblock/LC7 domain-containing protein [Gemmatimonadota bacterium]